MTQPGLFDPLEQDSAPRQPAQPVARLPHDLTSQSTLTAALAPYQAHMLSSGLAENTIKAFLGDINLLLHYFQEQGEAPKLGDIGTDDLNQFLYWMRYERTDSDGQPVPCSPKTYARRVTSLKSFFGWLGASEVLGRDPAAPVIQESVQAPLPQILYDDEVDRLVRTTRDLLWSPTKPDARPHLLVLLLVQTGLKKSEVMGIRLQDIDASNPREPVLTVRYADPRHAHKERRLLLGPDFMRVLAQYTRAYQPQDMLFECTARNLEYVLEDAAQLAGIKRGVSFETMRWTAAVRSYRFGVPPDALRQKMGLSAISWRDSFEKIKKLASAGL